MSCRAAAGASGGALRAARASAAAAAAAAAAATAGPRRRTRAAAAMNVHRTITGNAHCERRGDGRAARGEVIGLHLSRVRTLVPACLHLLLCTGGVNNQVLHEAASQEPLIIGPNSALGGGGASVHWCPGPLLPWSPSVIVSQANSALRWDSLIITGDRVSRRLRGALRVPYVSGTSQCL